VYAALDRIETDLEKDAPTGKIELGALPPEHVRYFFCREHLKKVDRIAQAVERSLTAPRRPLNAPKLPRAKPVKIVVRQFVTSNPRFDRRRDAVALKHNLADLDAEPVDVPDSPFTALLREIALLEALAAKAAEPEAALLVFRACLPADSGTMFALARCYADCLGRIWGASSMDVFGHRDDLDLFVSRSFNEPIGRTHALYLKGISLRHLVPDRANVILTRRSDGGTGIILMTLETATTEAKARARAKELAGSIDALEPDSFGPVIQRVIENKTLTDFRTGVVVSAQPTVEEFRALLLSALPLPPEVAQQLEN
jgi:hypothetical protein